MSAISLKKAALAAAAAAVALSAAAPASAGGGHHHGYYGKHHGKYYKHHYGKGYYKRPRHVHHHHHHPKKGLSGGEAALIAAGIIGGAILIDRALDDRRHDDRYYGYAPPPPPPRGYYGEPTRDLYYRRDDRAYASPRYENDYRDDYDDELLGGPAESRFAGRGEYNYGAAYNDCKAETRAAASDRGLLVALPAKPSDIRPIEGGAAVRFTTEFIARDLQGREMRQTMICEADLRGVRFIELV